MQRLPLDIQAQICCFLDLKNQHEVQWVSKQWNRACARSIVWMIQSLRSTLTYSAPVLDALVAEAQRRPRDSILFPSGAVTLALQTEPLNQTKVQDEIADTIWRFNVWYHRFCVADQMRVLNNQTYQLFLKPWMDLTHLMQYCLGISARHHSRYLHDVLETVAFFYPSAMHFEFQVLTAVLPMEFITTLECGKDRLLDVSHAFHPVKVRKMDPDEDLRFWFAISNLLQVLQLAQSGSLFYNLETLGVLVHFLVDLCFHIQGLAHLVLAHHPWSVIFRTGAVSDRGKLAAVCHPHDHRATLENLQLNNLFNVDYWKQSTQTILRRLIWPALLPLCYTLYPMSSHHHLLHARLLVLLEQRYQFCTGQASLYMDHKDWMTVINQCFPSRITHSHVGIKRGSRGRLASPLIRMLRLCRPSSIAISQYDVSYVPLSIAKSSLFLCSSEPRLPWHDASFTVIDEIDYSIFSMDLVDGSLQVAEHFSHKPLDWMVFATWAQLRSRFDHRNERNAPVHETNIVMGNVDAPAYPLYWKARNVLHPALRMDPHEWHCYWSILASFFE